MPGALPVHAGLRGGSSGNFAAAGAFEGKARSRTSAMGALAPLDVMKPAMAVPMDEKRRIPRQRTLKTGRIVFANGSFTVDCAIRNISDKGARLQVPTTVAIPDRFTLVEAQGGASRAAQVIWRKGDLMGITFRPKD